MEMELWRTKMLQAVQRALHHRRERSGDDQTMHQPTFAKGGGETSVAETAGREEHKGGKRAYACMKCQCMCE